MALKTIEIGAPSHDGKDAFELVETTFKAASYPLKLKVENLCPFNVSFPEVDCYLRNVFAAEASKATIVVPSYEASQRVASSVQQVAEMNAQATAMRICGEVVVKRQPKKAVEEPAAEETAAEAS